MRKSRQVSGTDNNLTSIELVYRCQNDGWKYGMYFGKFDVGLRTETERGLQVIFGKVTGNRVTGLRTAENRWISGHRIWIVLTAEATFEIRYNIWGSKWYKVEDNINRDLYRLGEPADNLGGQVIIGRVGHRI